ncbi:MAG: hypothetical protein HYR55_19115 [Acidobacteria bacterium]|nr:hypothetical protein [Acidobacteriota bacterium]MBI3654968.1 hypothetical protein [Acidobacteriota bacterium]
MESPRQACHDASGVALLLVLAILTTLSLLGLTMISGSLTEAQICENYSHDTTALMLAETGLHRALLELRGKSFSQALKGLSGRIDITEEEARTFDFRNPIPLRGYGLPPQRLDLGDPEQIAAAARTDVGMLPEIGRRGVGYYLRKGPDGRFGTADDEAFFESEQASRPDDALIGRYLVKVTNNPDDPGGPFDDRDGTLIIRSMGLVRMSPARRLWGARNAMKLLETRVRLDMTFETDAPITILGPSLAAERTRLLEPGRFRVYGNEHLGLAIINTTGLYMDTLAEPMTQQLLRTEGSEAVSGAGLVPSIRNLTSLVRAGQVWGGRPNVDCKRVLDAALLRRFIYEKLPALADQIYRGGDPGDAAWSGTIDRPRLTWVDGNLTITGSPSGAGLLIVTGRLKVTGNPHFRGLVLVIGEQAALDMDGQPRIEGGLWLARLRSAGEEAAFDTARLSLSGYFENRSDWNYQKLAMSLLPFVPLQWREIHPEMEP